MSIDNPENNPKNSPENSPENSLEHRMKSTAEPAPARSPLDDFDRLATVARDERPPLIRADLGVIRRQINLDSQRRAGADSAPSMPASLMIFSSALTGLAACAAVAVMLQMTHDASLSNPAGSTSSVATQVGSTSLSNPREGSWATSGSTGNPVQNAVQPTPQTTPQPGAQARNTSRLSSVDPVADLFQPLQLDLP